MTVNPDKPVDLFIDLIDKIDQVLIMTVYAGLPTEVYTGNDRQDKERF